MNIVNGEEFPMPMDDPQLPETEEPMPIHRPEPEPVDDPEPL